MILPLLVGALLVGLTVLIHGFGSIGLMRLLFRHHMDTGGNVLWASGAKARFGIGPFLLAEPAQAGAPALLFLMDDNGLLTLAEATPAGYKPRGQMQAVVHVDEDGEEHPGHDAWAPMALVHGRLLLRDLTRMVCLDVRK